MPKCMWRTRNENRAENLTVRQISDRKWKYVHVLARVLRCGCKCNGKTLKVTYLRLIWADVACSTYAMAMSWDSVVLAATKFSMQQKCARI